MGPATSWDDVRKTIKECFRQSGGRIAWLEQIRSELDNLASTGIATAPDFTLHNEAHSDNLVLLLGRLAKHFQSELSDYESYLLLTSAYLHDIGMFFGAGQFKQEIASRCGEALRFCMQDLCDPASQYQSIISGRPVGFQIRAVHHLLSAYMLQMDGRESFRLSADDRPHVIAICRGHRKANLCLAGCTCYNNKPVKTGEVRRDLLAALLRLADALDFYSDRAPKEAFFSRAPDFLEDAVALKHWMKHYFATAVYIDRPNPGGNTCLDCQLTFTVPDRKSINNIPYETFLAPLFAELVNEARASDFDVKQYPASFLQLFSIKDIKLTHQVEAEPGARELPAAIVRAIEQRGSHDVLQFLNDLEASRSEPSARVFSLPAILNRRPEVQAFSHMLEGEDPQHSLLILVGGHGQGKTWLVRAFEQLCLGQNLPCLRLDLSDTVKFEEILDGLWQRLGQHHFTQYSALRMRQTPLFQFTPGQRQHEMTVTFFAEWRAITMPSQVIVLLDTYEHAAPILQDWIEESFLEEISTISSAIVVIAGRQWPETGDYWKHHSHSFPLEGVQLRHYKEYAQQRRVDIPEAELAELHEKWRGLPKLFVEYVNLRCQGAA